MLYFFYKGSERARGIYEKINLAGEWLMKIPLTGGEHRAVLPGSDIGNLIRERVIENPLVRGDDKIGERLGTRDIEFSRRFYADADAIKYACIRLRSHSFDTLCTVLVNGKRAGTTNNAHRLVDIDLKPFLTEGENEIRLCFDSPVKYIKTRQKQSPLPPNNNGIDGAAYIRKPSCHFGWDWGPCLPYCAVKDYIYIKCFNREIRSVSINQRTSAEKSTVTISAENADRIYITSPSGEIIQGDGGRFVIENPQLWYTADMSGKSEQPLYTVHFENDEEKTAKKIGLRSLYLDRSRDEYGENFGFVLNGRRIFAKGANMIPFSAIYEGSDNSTVDYYLDLAQRSNFNMLRIWGGGEYAGEYFMEQCDKRGILVWQDFCYACLMYPFYESDFRENALAEARENAARLSLHPCLALLCGNNEIEAMFAYLPQSSRLVKAYVEFFYQTLPSEIKPITDVSYIPSSPLGEAPFKKCSDDGVGDTHMWNVWHGLKKLDYYQTRYTRFLSEFGLESLPSVKAIHTFADENDMSITGESFNRHQKCAGGNRKMLFYLKEMFPMPKNFEDLPYLTGIIQAECVRNAAIHFRRNPGRCNGVLYWQFNDVWNCPSWSSVDFEGVPKALQYKAREFFEPITVTCKRENGNAVIFAHNDTLECTRFDVEIILDGEKYTVTADLAPGEVGEIKRLSAGEKSVLTLKYRGNSKTDVFAPPKKLNLKKAHFTLTRGDNCLTVKSDVLAYGVCIECDAVASDNYFNLAPNEEKTVAFDGEPGEIKIRCANNIEYENKPIGEKLSRLLYRLEPQNIANYFYYSLN